MYLRPYLLIAVLTLAACGSRATPPPAAFTPTDDPVTRLVRSDGPAILGAGTAALREIGFTVDPPARGALRVLSEPLIVQHNWLDDPLAQRVLCGIGTAAESDPRRLRELANTIPVTLRLGYEVEPRAEATATSVIFVAEGRRTPGVMPASPTMSCTLTVAFIEELFRRIETRLAAAVDS